MGSVYLAANEEAVRRGDRRVGTEHLVLALLTGLESATTAALDVQLLAAREALDELDEQSLNALGLSLPRVGPIQGGGKKEQFKLTPAARSVFTGLRARAGGEALGIRHVLLALLALQPPDPAAVLLDRLGVDREAVRNRLGFAL
jgi:ATP-dependent Clp protease ATP-binding subunit ClpA